MSFNFNSFISVCVVLLSLNSSFLQAQDDLTVEIKNPAGVKSEAKIIQYSIKLGGQSPLTLLDSDNKPVPAWYDSSKQLLSIYDEIESEGNRYKFVKRRWSYVKPRWSEKLLKSNVRIQIFDEVYESRGFEINNGLFKVSSPVGKEVITPIIIQSLKNKKYSLTYYPLGATSGNILDKKFASGGVNNQKLRDNLFTFDMGIPTKIEISSINDFQKKISFECDTFYRMNSGFKENVVGALKFEVILTWNSPVIEVKASRKYLMDFYNHNGHYLSQFPVQKKAVQVVTDINPEAVTVQSPDRIINPYSPEQIDAWQSFKIQESKGDTIFSFPDYRSNCIYRPAFMVLNNRIVTAISQSGGEGWLPVLQKAGVYEDRTYIICDVTDKDKSLKQWLEEIDVKMPDQKEQIKYELRLLNTYAETQTFNYKKNSDVIIKSLMQKGKQKICKKFGISLEELGSIDTEK